MNWAELFALRWPDILWHIIPGLLIYQILGTTRHEVAHAIAFVLSGYKLVELHVLPHRYKDEFYWGRCVAEPQGGAKHNVHVYLAPYEVNAVAITIWFCVARWASHAWVANARLNWNLWALFTVLFLISPIVDLLYNLGKHVFAKRGDFSMAARFWETH
jgi:hypothetical protein